MSTVCTHGLGYVGLPTAAMLANYGHSVVGFDTSERVVTRLRNGDVHIDEPGLRAFVSQALEEGALEVSDHVVPAKYHLICVPTPFDRETKEADLEYVRAAASAIETQLRTGDTVILESTVPPGTTVETVQPLLESSGLSAGTDFALVHCPETVLPGDVITELRQNDRVVGGVNGVSTEAAIRLYDSFVEGEIHAVADATTAEFVKLVQNTYRDVNIALANELAKVAGDYGIDVREAIERANVHPRVDILQPGPGVGGHCLPIDPWFLGRDSDHLELIACARRVNDGMADYVIDRLERELGSFEGRRIAVLGAAYKANVDDTRGSPGLRIVERLRARGVSETAEADLRADDAFEASADGGEPTVDRTEPTVNGTEPTADGTEPTADGTEPATDGTEPTVDVVLCDPRVDDPELDLVDLEDAVAGADAAVLTVGHDEFTALEPDRLAERMNERLLFDTRGVLDANQWTEAGFTLRRL